MSDTSPAAWLPNEADLTLPVTTLRVPCNEQFLDDGLIEEGWSPKTATTYRQVLNSLALWTVEQSHQPFSPTSLTRAVIRDWQRELRTHRHLDDATYVKYLAALRSFIRYLRDTGDTELSAEDASLPRGYTDVSHVIPLSIEELTTLVATPSERTTWGRRDRALLATLYSTGMRIAEAVGRDRAELREPHLCDDDVMDLPIVGKGRKPRIVFLDMTAQHLLRAYLQSRTDQHTPLFISFRGPAGPDRRLSARQVQRALHDYAMEAGLTHIPTPHTLRHSFALHKLEAGADTRLIQAFLGHASIATTQRYTRVRDSYLHGAYEQSHRRIDLPPGS